MIQRAEESAASPETRPRQLPLEDHRQRQQEQHPLDDRAHRPWYRRPLVLGIIAAVVVVLIIGGLLWWLHARQYEKTDDAFVDGFTTDVSSRVAGHVQKLLVTDNQSVPDHHPLLQLDPADYQAAREQAQAALLAAQARLVQAQTNYERFHNMPAGAASPQEITNATTALGVAKADVEQAKANLNLAQLQLSYTTIYAPYSGRVTRRTVDVGQYVQPGQSLLSIVSPVVWVTANFKETQLTLMKPGQPVTVTVDAFPHQTYNAHVDSIQRGTGERFTLLPPENATGNWVKVVQRVPVKIIFDPDQNLPPLGVGMSVEVKVKVR